MSEQKIPSINLFNYASSEYWQDAVLCWMLAWASKGNASMSKGKYAGLHELGQDFVRLLLRGHEGKDMPKSIGNITIETQLTVGKRRRVDILATVNEKHFLLIEDKTDSSEGKNQLDDYFKGVLKKKNTCAEKVFPVYLKTGYVFADEEASARSRGYQVVLLNDMLMLFERHKNIENDVFVQYNCHCLKTSQNRDDTVAEALGGQTPPVERLESGYPAWDWEYAQWEFALKLKEKLESAENSEWMKFRAELPSAHCFPVNLDEWSRAGMGKGVDGAWADEANQTVMKRGRDQGGAAWTKYFFTKFLFWKIEAYYPLRLVLRIRREEVPGRDPWEYYQKCFQECFNECNGLAPREFKTKARSVERIVGALQPVDVETLLENIAIFQNAFVKKIAKIKWGE